jgi:hypothetical protein
MFDGFVLERVDVGEAELRVRHGGSGWEVWRGWAEDLRGRPLDCGHHLAEEVPEELAAEIRVFLAG